VELTAAAIASEVEWFERAFAEVLQVIAEGYGEPVHVRWGVVPFIG
jgi:hypothetical protein